MSRIFIRLEFSKSEYYPPRLLLFFSAVLQYRFSLLFEGIKGKVVRLVWCELEQPKYVSISLLSSEVGYTPLK